MILWLVDPTGEIRRRGVTSVERIQAACGFIPSFFDFDDDRPCVVQLRERYMFGCSPLFGVTIQEDGTWQYPDDPDLPPLMSADFPANNERVYIYQHAFVAVVKTDGSAKPYCTRCD